MKVIDLLNKIANGEEAPKKIKYKNKIYEWKEYDVCYGKIMTKKGWVKEHGYVAEENRTYFYLKHCYQGLNDEIEIIEEKPKVQVELTEKEYLEYLDKINKYMENNRNYIPKPSFLKLEEEKKIPEKLDDFTILVGRVDDSNIEEYIQKLFKQQFKIFNKINSIIDYLKIKGDE